MKNIIIVFALLGFMACQNQQQSESIHQENQSGELRRPPEVEQKDLPSQIQIATDTLHVHVYACPMHPEITGKEGDKCPKCGMALVHNDWKKSYFWANLLRGVFLKGTLNI